MDATTTPQAHGSYELRFMSLFREGRGLSFPCDPDGDVHLDELSERARTNYFYARTVIGREFATPAIVAH
jgi:hypothetical protein